MAWNGIGGIHGALRLALAISLGGAALTVGAAVGAALVFRFVVAPPPEDFAERIRAAIAGIQPAPPSAFRGRGVTPPPG